MLELRIHGYGGQGVVTMAELLALAALESGLVAQTLPFFGVERRGAPVKAALRVSDKPIHIYSQSVEPDFLVLMSEKLLDMGMNVGIKPESNIVLNAPANVAVLGHLVYFVDATGIAIANGLVTDGVPYINIPMYGALCRLIGIEAEVALNVIKNRWPGKVGEKNAAVAKIGYDSLKN